MRKHVMQLIIVLVFLVSILTYLVGDSVTACFFMLQAIFLHMNNKDSTP